MVDLLTIDLGTFSHHLHQLTDDGRVDRCIGRISPPTSARADVLLALVMLSMIASSALVDVLDMLLKVPPVTEYKLETERMGTRPLPPRIFRNAGSVQTHRFVVASLCHI